MREAVAQKHRDVPSQQSRSASCDLAVGFGSRSFQLSCWGVLHFLHSAMVCAKIIRHSRFSETEPNDEEVGPMPPLSDAEIVLRLRGMVANDSTPALTREWAEGWLLAFEGHAFELPLLDHAGSRRI